MIYVYSPDYSNRYPIMDTISIMEHTLYNDIGAMTMVIPLFSDSMAYLKTGGLIYNSKTNGIFEIQEIKFTLDEATIEVNGSTADDILRRRVVATSAVIIDVESDIYSLVNNNLRGLPNFETADIESLGIVVPNTTVFGDNVISAIQPILTDADCGRKIIWDDPNRKLIFKIYQGRDMTSGIHRIVFAEEFGTASDLVTDEDIMNWYNVCYVEADMNDEKIIEVAGTATGAERRETWTQFSGDGKADTETEQDFRDRVKRYGELHLGSFIKRQSFSVVIDSKDFGTKYQLGDKVKCSSMVLGLEFDARITGVNYKLDINGEDVKLTLGQPTKIMFNPRQ